MSVKGSSDVCELQEEASSLEKQHSARDPTRLKCSTPITISWVNLSYKVATKPTGKKKLAWKKTESRHLLKDLHGSIQPGELTCIMGPSGAGKTTLLNALLGKLQSGKMEGQVLINGTPQKKLGTSWKRLSAYVTQEDILSANLTPREELWFSARLRVGQPASQVKQRVEELIEELGLSACGNTRIGSPQKRGISGGQRKRASIGVEMITNPSVLFLDEPTSGLDYSTSYSLVETLRMLASEGRTIVSTIHQPSTDIFLMFDRLILVCEGHIIYQGPTSEVVSYFAAAGYPCAQYCNPAEHIMNLAKIDSYIGTKDEGIERVKALINIYRAKNGLRKLNSDEEPMLLLSEKQSAMDRPHLSTSSFKGSSGDDNNNNNNNNNLEEDRMYEKEDEEEEEEEEEVQRLTVFNSDIESSSPPKAEYSVKAEGEKRKLERSDLTAATPKPAMLLRFGLLVYRTLLERIREPVSTYVHLVQTLFLATVVGIIYLRIGDDDDRKSIDDRKGALFFVVTNECVDTLLSMVMIFEAERLIFVKEHSAGAYGTLVYFLAKTLAQLPFLAFFPVLFSCIAYWMIGLQAEPDNFFIFIAALIMVTLVSASLAIAVSACTPNLDTAMALLPAAFIPFTIFSGILVSEESVPVWIRWIKYFSIFRYGFNILAINEFDGLRFTCDPSEQINGTCIFAGTLPLINGQDVLEDLNLDKDEASIWASFLFLFMQLLMWNVIAYLGLRFTSGRKK